MLKKKKEKKTKGTNTAPQTDSIPLMEVGKAIRDEVLKTLQRPLAKLPSHKDISRLIDVIYVYNGNDKIFSNNGSKSEGIRSLISLVSKTLDSNKVNPTAI